MWVYRLRTVFFLLVDWSFRLGHFGLFIGNGSFHLHLFKPNGDRFRLRLHRLSLSLRGLLRLGRALGSSLHLRFGLCYGSSRLLGRLLADVVEIHLAQRLVLLLGGRFQKSIGTSLFPGGLTLLVFCFFLEQFFSLAAHFGILLELVDQRIILLIVEFEARFGLHLSQVVLLFKEFNCRLKSYVQFT